MLANPDSCGTSGSKRKFSEIKNRPCGFAADYHEPSKLSCTGWSGADFARWAKSHQSLHTQLRAQDIPDSLRPGHSRRYDANMVIPLKAVATWPNACKTALSSP